MGVRQQYVIFLLVAFIDLTWRAATTTTGSKLNITYWGGRAGAIGASQLPLVTALGTKNNPIACGWPLHLFSWPSLTDIISIDITGISYDKVFTFFSIPSRIV